MASLPKWRILSAETAEDRRALATLDRSALASARSAIAQLKEPGAAKMIQGRTITVRAVDVKAIFEGKRFQFVQSEAHYLNLSGGGVPDVTLKASANSIIANAQARSLELVRQLRAKEISLDEWRHGMQIATRDGQVAQTALAHGGFDKIPVDAIARTEDRLFAQFNGVEGKFPGLQGFASDIAGGRYGEDHLGNAATNRTILYPQASRTSYENEYAEAKRNAGFDEVCRILAASHHCESCLAEAARGFVLLDDATPVGGDDCGGGCHCSQVFRRAGQESGPVVNDAIEQAKRDHAIQLQINAEKVKTA